MKPNRKKPTAATNDTTEPSVARRIEKRKVAELTPYHRQDAMFHPLSEPEFKRLVEDMKKNGQLNPIEIVIDGSIIDGHQRVRAARVLGWSEVDVRIRDDLHDEWAIELRHIAANRTRRQLDQLDQVRLAVREFEIQKRRSPGELSAWDKGELKKHVARQIDRVPRHAQRLLNVVAAPMEIQRAYSNGVLKIELAEKVHALREDVREAIASEIRAGTDAVAAVNAHLPKRKRKVRDVSAEFGKLVAAMAATMDAIVGRECEIDRSLDDTATDLDVLSRFMQFNRKLRPLLKRKQAFVSQLMDEMRVANPQLMSKD